MQGSFGLRVRKPQPSPWPLSSLRIQQASLVETWWLSGAFQYVILTCVVVRTSWFPFSGNSLCLGPAQISSHAQLANICQGRKMDVMSSSLKDLLPLSFHHPLNALKMLSFKNIMYYYFPVSAGAFAYFDLYMQSENMHCMSLFLKCAQSHNRV